MIHYFVDNEDITAEPLGLMDQAIIIVAIDHIMVYAVSPLLVEGTSAPLERRLPSDITENTKVIAGFYIDTISPRQLSAGIDLAGWMSRLSEIALMGEGTISDVGNLLRSRFLPDMLAGLLQAAYAPLPEPDVAPGTKTKGASQRQRSFELAIIDSERKKTLRKHFSTLFKR